MFFFDLLFYKYYKFSKKRTQSENTLNAIAFMAFPFVFWAFAFLSLSSLPGMESLGQITEIGFFVVLFLGLIFGLFLWRRYSAGDYERATDILHGSEAFATAKHGTLKALIWFLSPFVVMSIEAFVIL